MHILNVRPLLYALYNPVTSNSDKVAHPMVLNLIPILFSKSLRFGLFFNAGIKTSTKNNIPPIQSAAQIMCIYTDTK